jgi:PAS domain S-box-containing protein
VVLALDGTLTYANPHFLQLAGITAEQMPTLHLQSLLSRAGAIFYETLFAPALLLRGILREVALDIQRDSGERILTLVNARVRRSPTGAPEAIYMAFFEATERRQYEQELLRARNISEQVAEVVRHSSDAIITVTPEGMVRSWNHGAVQMFGISAEEAGGQSFVPLFMSPQRQVEIGEAMLFLHRGKEVKLETIAHRKDGTEIYISIALTPHMEAPGTLVAYSAIIRDVSSRKRAELALIQSEKLASVGRLASSIAHEINNPLESVTNLLYILNHEVDTPELKVLVHTAQEELARVSQIATHTLRFHRQSSNRTEVDLDFLLTSVVALYRGRLQNSSIEARIDGRDKPRLICHEGELRQILLNLVANAFDAMRTGGTLTLRHREAILWGTSRKGVRITVADTGTGMDSEIMKRIFDPFFTTKGIGGTGLGLWVTQDLIEKNGGVISMKSTAKGSQTGTVFCIWFPHRTEA